MVEMGCPGSTIIEAVGSLREPAVDAKVVEHVMRCQHCRGQNHTSECISYSETLSINMMPAKMTLEQAQKIQACPACKVAVNEDALKVMHTLLGH